MNELIKRIPFLIFSLFILFPLCKGQVPENDSCVNADSLVIDECMPFDVDMSDANASEANICTQQKDVWFKFLYDTPDAITISLSLAPGNSAVLYSMSLYRIDCDSLEILACDLQGVNALVFTFFNPELQGQMIFIAMSFIDVNSPTGVISSQICVEKEMNDLGANDICTLAKTINVNPSDVCVYSYSPVISSNHFSGISNPCINESNIKDQWLNFIVPENGRFIFNFEALSGTSINDLLSIALYKGSCDKLELITCFQPTENDFLKLFHFPNMGGEALFVQVIVGTVGTIVYHLCVSNIGDTAFHENDACEFAQSLLINEEVCLDPFIANNTDAFDSQINLACPGYEGADIWFSFIMPNSGKAVIETKSIFGSPVFDGVMTLYSGTCNELSFIACDDDSGQGSMPAYKIFDVALAGQEIYIQFWDFNGNDEGEFSICVIEPGDSNSDECIDANFVTQVDINQCFENDSSIFSLLPNSFSGVTPGCGNVISADIWFEFSYTVGQRLVFEFDKVDDDPLFDGQAAIYRGSCDDLIFISCDDDSGNGIMPLFDMEEIIDDAWDFDQNFFIKFWDFNQGVGGEVSYCLYEKETTKQTNLNSQSIILYPNPTVNDIQVVFPTYVTEPVQWKIFSIEGRLIKEGLVKYLDDNNSIKVITKDLMPSSYILSIKTSNQHWLEKFLKFVI